MLEDAASDDAFNYSFEPYEQENKNDISADFLRKERRVSFALNQS